MEWLNGRTLSKQKQYKKGHTQSNLNYIQNYCKKREQNV